MNHVGDALLLARIQFAFTLSFPIIFPAISIGVASYLAVLEGLWLRTGKVVYRELFFFLSKMVILPLLTDAKSGAMRQFPHGAVEIDQDTIKRYPREFAPLAYLLDKSGFPVNRVFATKGSDLEKSMKADREAWLARRFN